MRRPLFLLGSGSVALAGAVGFVGLVVPHLTRLLLGASHRYLIPGSVLTGAFIVDLG